MPFAPVTYRIFWTPAISISFKVKFEQDMPFGPPCLFLSDFSCLEWMPIQCWHGYLATIYVYFFTSYSYFLFKYPEFPGPLL